MIRKYIDKIPAPLRNLFRFLLFCVILLVVFSQLTLLFKTQDQNDTSIDLFYELPRNSVDVVVVGSSHVYCGYSPALFWQESGIPNAMMAASKLSAPVSYFYCREAIRLQHPKVLYLDVFGFLENFQVSEQRNVMVCGESLNKVDAVNDIKNEDQTYLDFNNLTFHHNNWKTLNEDSFTYYAEKPYRLNRGFPFSELMLRNYDPSLEKDAVSDTVSVLSEERIAYLVKIIDMCENSGTRLVCMKFPYFTTSSEDALYSQISELLASRGVDWVDMNEKLDLVITDFSDRGHANIYGAEKFSSWLAGYSAETYGLKSRAGEAKYRAFDESVSYYYSERNRLVS